MKAILFGLTVAAGLALSAAAADVTLSDVHICCKSCVSGAEKAVGEIKGAKAVASIDDENVKITAPDKATLQKAVDALVAAGYFGKSSDPSITVTASTGAKDAKVKTATVSGVHLCCDKCAKAVDKAVKAVPGVTGDTAKKNDKSFEVTGDFNQKDLMDALQKSGLTGKVM